MKKYITFSHNKKILLSCIIFLISIVVFQSKEIILSSFPLDGSSFSTFRKNQKFSSNFSLQSKKSIANSADNKPAVLLIDEDEEYFASLPTNPNEQGTLANNTNRINENKKRKNSIFESGPILDELQNVSDAEKLKDQSQRTLPYGIFEKEYCTHLDPGWGNPPYTWNMSKGILPKGLLLDISHGMLCGIPKEKGVWLFRVKISDASNNFIFVDYTLAILEFEIKDQAGELRIHKSTLASGFVGIKYFAQLTASGGNLPFRWSISALPLGLNFDRELGVIYGIPIKKGDYSLRITVNDAQSNQASESFTLAVDTSPLYIQTTSLPTGTIGANYYQEFQAQGGNPPYAWQAISGVIPEGIFFNTNSGILFGVPQKAQSETLRFQVIDTQGDTDIVELKIHISGGALLIITKNISSGTVGEIYYSRLQAVNGVPPYSWQLIDGKLPRGIEFQDTGILIGTPLEKIDTFLRVRVRDQIDSNEGDFYLTISPAPLEITTKTLREASTGVSYYQSLTAQGGVPPYRWSIESGSLPEDIRLQEDGVLTGIPTQLGFFEVTITITDSQNETNNKKYFLFVNNESLSIVDESLEVGLYQKEYFFEFSAQGGTPPYTWELTSGSLPQGLTLNPSGLLSGVPRETGIFPFELKVSDSHGHWGSKDLHIDILEERLAIDVSPLPAGSVGSNYEHRLQAKGGISPYLWSIFSGGLPEGLQLNVNTGTISGIPVKSGIFSAQFQVTDTLGNWDVKDFEVTIIGSSLEITTDSLPEGTFGLPYNFTMNASGGNPPYSWSISSGSLPSGLGLDTQTGDIVGTPLETKEVALMIKVQDTAQQMDIKNFTLKTNNPTLTILTESLPEGQVDTNYTSNLLAQGGVPPYQWSLTGGQLPSGLVLNNQTGNLSGIPSEAVENIGLTFRATDSENKFSEKELFFSITSADKQPVTNLIARASHHAVGLAWNNPNQKDFDRVTLVRHSDHFPIDPSDGVTVYAGSRNNTVDETLTAEKNYFYTAFAFYKDGSYALPNDNAKTSAIPKEVTLLGDNDPYCDEVVQFNPLDPNNDYGRQNMPDVVLGTPLGTGEWTGSLHVVSLHAKVNNDSGQTPPYGGSIILKFSDNIVINRPGVDFTVFENSFRMFGTDRFWMEPAVIDVSIDGVNFVRFPFDYVPHFDENGALDIHHPYSYAYGFAGLKPVYSSNHNPDPTDPAVSGGDSFDLSDLPKDLTWIQYIRITSTGDNWLTDQNGDYVRHTNDWPSWGASGTGNSGFDLDAVCAVHY